jgi:lipopolysaccharide export LptBFGC system permease protein LptF
MLKKILIIAAASLAIYLAFRYCEFKDDEGRTTMEETTLIQEQIKNVGKLVVTEGHFSEVITYKNQQKYLMDLYTAEKKAIVIVNADVTVAYDLSKVEYDINEATKTITIKSIPKEEIKISPDLKFYDMEQDRFNTFNGDDYNKINKQVKESLAKKIEKSSLKTNAQNRLISELQKILILTNTMGWTLQYNNVPVDNKNINTLL